MAGNAIDAHWYIKLPMLEAQIKNLYTLILLLISKENVFAYLEGT